jgi:hypothetical protein
MYVRPELPLVTPQNVPVAPKAGHVLKDFISRCCDWENRKPHFQWDAATIFDQCCRGAVPFVDLWVWLRHLLTEIDKALNLLRELMIQIRPFVVVAMSTPVSKIATSSFAHLYGFSGNLLPQVGVPRIAFLDNSWMKTEQPTPPADDAFIVIPHLDPGVEKYGVRHPALAKVMDLTWILTMVYADVALEMVESIRSRQATGKPVDRLTMCTEIMNEANTIFKESGFLWLLGEAKAELLQAVGSKTRGTVSDPEALSRNLSKATKSTIEMCGFAEYAPNSEERKQQVDFLWKMNYPTLCCNLGLCNVSRE